MVGEIECLRAELQRLAFHNADIPGQRNVQVLEIRTAQHSVTGIAVGKGSRLRKGRLVPPARARVMVEVVGITDGQGTVRAQRGVAGVGAQRSYFPA